MRSDKPNYRPWRLTGRNTAFSALAVAVLLAAGTAQAAMYRWVDGNGRVHYSDTLPPSYQKSGAAEMNKRAASSDAPSRRRSAAPKPSACPSKNASSRSSKNSRSSTAR